MSLHHRLEAWRELWKRYRDVWLHAWSQRHELTLPRLNSLEAEFLPAALSLQASPVSPAGRWVGRILIGLIVVLLLWSILGKVDIVVAAQGKIIPLGYTKTIAAAEIASVAALYVQEGQAVKAGDVLIELDSRMVGAEQGKAEGVRESAELQAARSRALLAAMANGDRQPPRLPWSNVSGERRLDAESHLADQWRDFIAKRTRLDESIRSYSEELPLAARRARDYADLAKAGDVSEHAWIEKEQQRIEIERQLKDARTQKAALIAETRKSAQDALADAERLVAESAQDMRRAQVHRELLKLTSPVDGTVQQLIVHTVGSAIPAAQPLMQIVPKAQQVEMEAFIENKDIGFVHENQEVAAKIDAFEYTRYGTIPAHVSHVSRDAIQDEKRGLIYAVKVVLDRRTIEVEGLDMALTPGMSGSVEIKTGERRVIQYFLSPLIQHVQESLHER